MTCIKEEDILIRVLSRKPFWFHGPPKVILRKPTKGNFGTLCFLFEEEICFRIYIGFDSRHFERIKKVATNAILNHNQFLQALFEI